MTEEESTNLDHLRWVIKSRSENQRCALILFELLTKYPKQWKEKKYSLAAQALVGVTFSLWRAAFLADKSGERGKARKSAVSFLQKVIQDNAISYPQDRAEKEWTFNYYVSNASYTLRALAEKWRDLVPTQQSQKKGTPKERWEYHQNMLTQTVSNFQKTIGSKS
jgi:hypothetical protein